MADIINAEDRESFGKGAARKLRAAGRTPAVIYGLDKAPHHVTFDAHQIYMEVRSNANAVFTIAVNGKKQLALVKDIQVNPLSRVIEHIDLLRVKADQKVEVEVPLEVKNEPKDGAIATLEIMHLLVEAPATDIPDMIEIDVDGLEDGTAIRVADLKLPEGVTTAIDPEENVVIVAIPKAEELPEAEAGADGAAGEAPAEAAE